MFMRVVVTTDTGFDVVAIWDGDSVVELYSGSVQEDQPAEVIVLDGESQKFLVQSRNPSQLADRVVDFMRQYDPNVVVHSIVAEVLLSGSFPK